jgi:hypothetical protein
MSESFALTIGMAPLWLPFAGTAIFGGLAVWCFVMAGKCFSPTGAPLTASTNITGCSAAIFGVFLLFLGLVFVVFFIGMLAISIDYISML